MTKELVFGIISSLSGLIPVIALVYNYKHLTGVFKIISAFLITSLVFDILLWVLPYCGISNNVPLMHLFIILNIIYFALVYYKIFFSKSLKIFALVLSSFALVFALYYCKNLNHYPSQSNTASGITFILFSLLYFYQLLNRQEFLHIEKQGLFWFNTGVLMYFSINIFLFMLFTKLPEAKRPIFYMINNITNVIANLVYTIALLCKPQKTT